MCDWLVCKTSRRAYALRGKTEAETAREILAAINKEPAHSFFELAPVSVFYSSKDAARNERHSAWLAHRLYR